MSIEFKIQTIQIDQEQLHTLLMMINSYLPKKKMPKRRKVKPKITAGQLINEIIDDIEI
jgi:hypothetical protein